MKRGRLPIHSIASNNSNPELEEHRISAAIHAVPEKMHNTSGQPFPRRKSHTEMWGKKVLKNKSKRERREQQSLNEM